MRIIGGAAKGRRLRAPTGRQTRPTSDRVREALFSITEARLPLAGAAVLDLFAGSGALGLEALSRGAASAVFVDRDKRCCATVEANARTLGFRQQCTVMCAPVTAAIGALSRDGRAFELVFLDPPYATEPWKALEMLAAGGLLPADGLAVAEHATKVTPPTCPTGLEQLLTRRYGDTSLTVYSA